MCRFSMKTVDAKHASREGKTCQSVDWQNMPVNKTCQSTKHTSQHAKLLGKTLHHVLM